MRRAQFLDELRRAILGKRGNKDKGLAGGRELNRFQGLRKAQTARSQRRGREAAPSMGPIILQVCIDGSKEWILFSMLRRLQKILGKTAMESDSDFFQKIT